MARDRLEPSAFVHDIIEFDNIATYPFDAVFWRPSRQTITLHRNPLFGIRYWSYKLLMIDALHTIHLGLLHRFMWFVFWTVVRDDTLNIGLTLHQAKAEVSLQRFRAALFSWYRLPPQRTRSRKGQFTEVKQLTLGMFGSSKRIAIKIKAKEGEGITEFITHRFLDSVARRMPVVSHLRECGSSILRYLQLCREAPGMPAPRTMQTLFDLGMSHLRSAHAAGIPFGPKHHLFVHMLNRTLFAGNPATYSTFLDESLNQTLASISKAACASVWERRVLDNIRTLPAHRRGAKPP